LLPEVDRPHDLLEGLGNAEVGPPDLALIPSRPASKTLIGREKI
jgi:hypothetical protein